MSYIFHIFKDLQIYDAMKVKNFIHKTIQTVAALVKSINNIYWRSVRSDLLIPIKAH